MNASEKELEAVAQGLTPPEILASRLIEIGMRSKVMQLAEKLTAAA